MLRNTGGPQKFASKDLGTQNRSMNKSAVAVTSASTAPAPGFIVWMISCCSLPPCSASPPDCPDRSERPPFPVGPRQGRRRLLLPVQRVRLDLPPEHRARRGRRGPRGLRGGRARGNRVLGSLRLSWGLRGGGGTRGSLSASLSGVPMRVRRRRVPAQRAHRHPPECAADVLIRVIVSENFHCSVYLWCLLEHVARKHTSGHHLQAADLGNSAYKTCARRKILGYLVRKSDQQSLEASRRKSGGILSCIWQRVVPRGEALRFCCAPIPKCLSSICWA